MIALPKRNLGELLFITIDPLLLSSCLFLFYRGGTPTHHDDPSVLLALR